MKVSELYQKLKSSNLPVVYYQWQEGSVPSLPYLIYYFPSSDDEFADNVNYHKKNNLNVELYTKEKDFETEMMIENLLNENGLTFRRSESYIDSEKMYEVLYESEVLIDGE